MSRGTMYNVLHDTSGSTSDQIQQMCYSLCFLAERATRTISIVAPAYRASIAALCTFFAAYPALDGRMFMEENETGSVSSRGTGSGPPPVLKNVVTEMQKQSTRPILLLTRQCTTCKHLVVFCFTALLSPGPVLSLFVLFAIFLYCVLSR